MDEERMEMVEEQEKPLKHRVMKYSLNIVLFLSLIYLTFTILLKNEDLGEIGRIIRSARVEFVLLGMLFMAIYYGCESINIHRTLNALGEKCSLISAVKYALIGVFFSAITPAASGGQAVQIVAMHRDKIKVSSGTVSLVLNLLGVQVITISMELIAVCFLHEYMDTGIIALFVIGILLNSSALTLLIIGMCSKKLSTVLVTFAKKVLRWLKVKNYEIMEKKMQDALDSYHEGAKLIRNNYRSLVKHLFTTFMQHVAYYSVPFCVLHAFGLPSKSYWLTVGLQSIVFGTVSGIPSPGSVGVSEGAFQSIFRPIFTETYINSAMILHRVMSFYLPVAICAVVVLVWLWKKPKKSETQNNDKEKQSIAS